MKFFQSDLLLTILYLLVGINLFGQTLVLNEVSNGPSGNKEYMEFVVVSNTVSYDCTSLVPPCIDIRGWIIDDNSGYHGTAGIAPGALRFSFNPIWSCVPLGTIILIYNDGERNDDIPVDDLLMDDGNCTIITPVSNTALFESNTETPGAEACSYPSTGWTPGGSWNNLILANSGDCARVVDLMGCEVFSVCWGTDNLNNIIYFNGSGADDVWYFNDGDPNLQANWSEGCAGDLINCGGNLQTPGAPNNALNEAYIAQFNNSCNPITPIDVSAISTNADCGCTGSATATANGSIPGYSFEWYDANFDPIGQPFANALDLCAGTYHVIATSSIGCEATATVEISSINNVTVSANSSEICSGQPAQITATPSITGGSFSWSPNGETTQSISVSPNNSSSYTVIYSYLNCQSSAEGVVTVNQLPNVNGGPDQNICQGSMATLVGTGASTYTWNNGVLNNVAFAPATGTTNYLLTGTDANGCSNTDQVKVTVHPPPAVNAGQDRIICEGTATTLNGTGAVSYVWDNGVTDGISFIAPSGTTTYTVVGTDAIGCFNSDQILISVNQAEPVTFSLLNSIGCVPLTVDLTNTTSNSTDCHWSFSNGTNINDCNSVTLTFDDPGCFDVTLNAVVNGCPSSSTASDLICVESLPIASFSQSTYNLTSLESSVQFQNNSVGATNFVWSFGDGSTSFATHPTYSYDSDAAVYDVMLIASSNSGCSDTAYSKIKIHEDLIYYVPNTFTPDGDEFNQVFKPVFTSGFDPFDFSLLIFNRWGEIIFESKNKDIGWDGTIGIGNQVASNGMYTWKLEFKLLNNDERKVEVGHVNLLR